MKKSKVLLASLGFITGGAMAGTMGPVGPELPSRVVSLSIGPAWHASGESSTLFLTPAIEKSYVAHKTSRALAFGELFYGMQRQLGATWMGQLGLAGVVTSDAKVGGEVWDDADPAFNTRNYAYSVNHARLAIKGKVLAQLGEQWLPYVSASIGLGFNRSHGYITPPIIFPAVADAAFASHTQTSFAWTVGLGVERSVNANWRLGAGYELADLGRSRLGLAPGQTQGQGLGLNHLYTNALVLSAHYLR